MEERECPFCHKMVWVYSKYCMYCNQEMPPWNPMKEEPSQDTFEVEVEETAAEPQPKPEPEIEPEQEPVAQPFVQPEIEPVQEPVAQAVRQPEFKPAQEPVAKQELHNSNQYVTQDEKLGKKTFSKPANIYEEKQETTSAHSSASLNIKSKAEEANRIEKEKSMYQDDTSFDLQEYLKKNKGQKNESFKTNDEKSATSELSYEEAQKLANLEAFQMENPCFTPESAEDRISKTEATLMKKNAGARQNVDDSGANGIMNYGMGRRKRNDNPYLHEFLEQDIRMFVGYNSSKYIKKFTKIEMGKSTFNWSVFFFSFNWFAYRKMFSAAVKYYVIMNAILYISILLLLAIAELNMTTLGIWILISMSGTSIMNLVMAVRADKVYWKHCQEQLRGMGLRYRKTENSYQPNMMLRKVGGTSCGKVFLFWIVAGFIGYLLELVFGIAIRALVDPDQFFNLLLRAVTNLYSLC